MIAAKQGELTFPVRWWSFGPFWRYEQPQRGRTREFFQWNIDLLGADDPRADAEIVAVAASFFREVGFQGDEVLLQVNSRHLMDRCLARVGIEGDAKKLAFRWIDKRDKLSPQDWRAYALSLGFAESQMNALEPVLENRELWRESEELATLFESLDAYGVRDLVLYEPSVIRGLDYYTGTVYETTLNDFPQIGSICSGGRYDNLASHYTKSKLPGVGISIGATRLFWQLMEAGLAKRATSTVQALVTQMDEAQLPAYLALATELRAAGIATEVVLEPRKLQKQLQYADRAGVRFAIIVGSDELAKGVVTVKDLRKQDQFEVPRAELARTLRVEIEQAAVMPVTRKVDLSWGSAAD